MAKLWFKASRLGWGWRPASIEGWLSIGVHLLLTLAGVLLLARLRFDGMPPAAALLLLLLWVAVLAAVFLRLGYAKGEPPHWLWQ